MGTDANLNFFAMTIERISPLLLVSDLDRSITFYTKQLGFQLDFKYQDFYAGLTKDGHSIHLKIGKPVRQDLELLFATKHIESCYQELSGRQVNISQELRTMPYGKEFYITDPDGNTLAFVSIPSS